MARVYEQQHKYPEALQLLREALGIYKTKFGDEHPSTVKAQRTLEGVRLAVDDMLRSFVRHTAV